MGSAWEEGMSMPWRSRARCSMQRTIGERWRDVDWDVRTEWMAEEELCVTAECLKLPSLMMLV